MLPLEQRVRLSPFHEVMAYCSRSSPSPSTERSRRSYIEMERGTNDTYAIHLVVSEGSRGGFTFKRDEANSKVVDYLFDKYKDGVNL